MTDKCGVLLDNSVIIEYCRTPQKRIGIIRAGDVVISICDLASFLESHPMIGLTTREIKDDCVSRLNQITLDSFRRFTRFENCLKTESVPFSELSEKLTEVESVFSEIVDKKRRQSVQPPMVSSRYRSIADEIYLQQISKEPDSRQLSHKIFRVPVEIEDKRMAATAAVLSGKYENMFLTSTDEHLTYEAVSKALQEKFGFHSGTPKEILPKIKYLFK